jgi:hypothetical protein
MLRELCMLLRADSISPYPWQRLSLSLSLSLSLRCVHLYIRLETFSAVAKWDKPVVCVITLPRLQYARLDNLGSILGRGKMLSSSLVFNLEYARLRWAQSHLIGYARTSYGECVYTGCGKLASFFHIALKKSSKDIFSIFFITKGTHLKVWFTSF